MLSDGCTSSEKLLPFVTYLEFAASYSDIATRTLGPPATLSLIDYAFVGRPMSLDSQPKFEK